MTHYYTGADALTHGSSVLYSIISILRNSFQPNHITGIARAYLGDDVKKADVGEALKATAEALDVELLQINNAVHVSATRLAKAMRDTGRLPESSKANGTALNLEDFTYALLMIEACMQLVSASREELLQARQVIYERAASDDTLRAHPSEDL